MPKPLFLDQHTGLWSMCFKSHAVWVNVGGPSHRSHKKKATKALVIRRSQGLAARQGLSSIRTVSEASHIGKLLSRYSFVT